jgi:hypothetical protein
MQVNALLAYDARDNVTGCCPRYKPEGRDNQGHHFKDKPFVKAKTESLFYVPVNMGSVLVKTSEAIEKAHAQSMTEFIVLSRNLSPWETEHYFAVDKPVPGAEIVKLSDDYRSQVFEGPYKDAPKWQAAMETNLSERGEKAEETHFFYTPCPKCAKVYGQNYVVGVAKIAPVPGSASVGLRDR